MMIFKNIYFKLPLIIWLPINFFFSKLINPIYYDFVNKPYGDKYNLSKIDRFNLLKKIFIISNKIESATSKEVHITLIKHLLSLPKDNVNYVVECGCYHGASSASLSIICKIIGRKLIIYDSFEGLPSEENMKERIYPHLLISGFYKKGMYKSNLDIVKNNIKLYGDLSVCEFRKGFFKNTLIDHKEDIDFLFLDVDLTSSTSDSVKFLWPFIKDNSYIFTDDACDFEIVKFWFDEKWWNEQLNISAPGFIGSGCGLPISNQYSSLGYTIKNLNKKNLENINWLYDK